MIGHSRNSSIQVVFLISFISNAANAMILYRYIDIRAACNYAAVFGFLVPYFDLDVILLPTPP